MTKLVFPVKRLPSLEALGPNPLDPTSFKRTEKRRSVGQYNNYGNEGQGSVPLFKSEHSINLLGVEQWRLSQLKLCTEKKNPEKG